VPRDHRDLARGELAEAWHRTTAVAGPAVDLAPHLCSASYGRWCGTTRVGLARDAPSSSCESQNKKKRHGGAAGQQQRTKERRERARRREAEHHWPREGICRPRPHWSSLRDLERRRRLEFPRGARCVVSALAIGRCRYSRWRADRRRWGNLTVLAAALQWISTGEKGKRTGSFWVLSFRDWSRPGEPKLTVREGGAEGRRGWDVGAEAWKVKRFFVSTLFFLGVEIRAMMNDHLQRLGCG
jgi:hypothetical protein